MTKRFIAAMLLLVAATFAASAQQMPPGKWWQREEIIQELELTEDQRDRLDEVFRAAANDLIDAKGSVDKLQVAMRSELDRPQPRRAEILRIAAQLNDARGRLFERELVMLLDMRGVLTEAQWKEVRKHLDRMQERPGGMRGQGQRPNNPRGRRIPGRPGARRP